MKKLIFALLGTLVLVSCKPAVGGNDDEVIEETTITTPAGTPEGTPELPPYNPWVQVVADIESTSGIGYFFIDSRVSNPLADLVADEKIRLDFVCTKTSNREDRYFGPEDDAARTIKVYKVFVNKDNVTDSIYLEDEKLIRHSNISTAAFRFKIDNNSWKMEVVASDSDGLDINVIKYFNEYYD